MVSDPRAASFVRACGSAIGTAVRIILHRLPYLSFDHESKPIVPSLPMETLETARGIWHGRFVEKRREGEWFELSATDIASF